MNNSVEKFVFPVSSKYFKERNEIKEILLCLFYFHFDYRFEMWQFGDQKIIFEFDKFLLVLNNRGKYRKLTWKDGDGGVAFPIGEQVGWE